MIDQVDITKCQIGYMIRLINYEHHETSAKYLVTVMDLDEALTIAEKAFLDEELIIEAIKRFQTLPVKQEVD